LWRRPLGGQGCPAHRYRCHTGHVYTEKALYEIQGINIEESLWVSIRMLEERRNLIASMVRHSESRSSFELTLNYKENLQEIEKHIQALKYILRKLVDVKES
jgi:two-component system chemotaxis response regulator CheB